MDVSAVQAVRLSAKNNSAGYSPKMLVDPLPRDDNLLVTLRSGVPGRWNSKKPTKKLQQPPEDVTILKFYILFPSSTTQWPSIFFSASKRGEQKRPKLPQVPEFTAHLSWGADGSKDERKTWRGATGTGGAWRNASKSEGFWKRIYIYRLHFILELLWGFLVCMFFFGFGGV